MIGHLLKERMATGNSNSYQVECLVLMYYFATDHMRSFSTSSAMQQQREDQDQKDDEGEVFTTFNSFDKTTYT